MLLAGQTNESNSSGHMESDGFVTSETVRGTTCEHSENVLPQEGESLISSTSAESYRQLGRGRRRRGRPRKEALHPFLSAERRLRSPADLGSVQHQDAGFVTSLTTHVDNHISDNVCKTVEGPFVENLPCGNISDGITKEDIPEVLRRTKRRIMPKKLDIEDVRPVFAKVNGASAFLADANSLSVATRRIRKRDHPPARNGVMIEPDCEIDPVDTKEILQESKDPFRHQDPRRKGPEPVDHLVIGEGVEQRDEPMAIRTDRKETGRERGDGFQCHKSVVQQFPELKEGATLQAVLHPEPAVESEDVSPEDVNNLQPPCSPTQSNGPKIQGSTDVNGGKGTQLNNTTESLQHHNSVQNVLPTDVPSTEKLAQIIPILTAVKTENVEIELNSGSPVSESSTRVIFKQPKNTKATPEEQLRLTVAYKRKRGGKRRRRLSHILLQTAHLKEGQEISAGELDVGSAQTNNMNVSYIKKGGKTLLKCGDCSQVFRFLSQYVIHQRVHTGERPYQCPECDKAFSKNSNLNLHLKTHRKNDGSQKCQICQRRFPSSEYGNHVKCHTLKWEFEQSGKASLHETAHVPTPASTPTFAEPSPPEAKVEKVCQYCGKTFRFQSALIRHVRIHTGEKPFKCDICGKAFGQAYFLRVHELTHWSVKRYNCTRCEKSFAHYSNARKHTCRPLRKDTDSQRSRPSLTYTCHICKSISESLHQFNSHMREHTGTKLYRCLYCDKLFGDPAEFSSHRTQCLGGRAMSSGEIREEQRVSLVQYKVPRSRSTSVPMPDPEHKTPNKSKRAEAPKKRPADSRRPFQSTVIASHPLSRFVSRLNSLDASSDPRKYLCPSCGRLFRHMGRLRAHMLTHTPAQSYVCACCGKTLESWRKLWLHQRVHRQRRGRFACPQCGRGFRFAEAYKRHMSEHPDFQWVQVRPKRAPLPYQCEQCRGSFKTLDQLFSHQLCHISMQEPQRESHFDLSVVDDCNALQSHSRVVILPANSLGLTGHPKDGSSAPSAAVKYRYLLPKTSPQNPNGFPVQPQGLAVSKSTPSVQDQNNRTDKNCDRGVGSSLGRPITHIRMVKRQAAQSAAVSNEGSSEEVKCVVCGSAYPAIADLYQHYLKHARDEV